jgi:hypothetical protein
MRGYYCYFNERYPRNYWIDCLGIYSSLILRWRRIGFWEWFILLISCRGCLASLPWSFVQDWFLRRGDSCCYCWRRLGMWKHSIMRRCSYRWGCSSCCCSCYCCYWHCYCCCLYCYCLRIGLDCRLFRYHPIAFVLIHQTDFYYC